MTHYFILVQTMFKLITLVCFINCCLVRNGYSSEADLDYYWKDYYNGHVPSDAIPGGYDKNGNSTYVAVVVHPGGRGLLPANLYPGSYAITQSSLPNTKKQVHSHTVNVKVLCSRHHNRYKWVPINIGNIDKINGTLVRGGHYWDYDHFIGRALYKGELKVGRVFRPEAKFKGLWLPDTVKSGEFKNFLDFAILVYYAPCSFCRDD